MNSEMTFEQALEIVNYAIAEKQESLEKIAAGGSHSLVDLIYLTEDDDEIYIRIDPYYFVDILLKYDYPRAKVLEPGWPKGMREEIEGRLNLHNIAWIDL